jgi:hypothetical protein
VLVCDGEYFIMHINASSMQCSFPKLTFLKYSSQTFY